MSVDVTGHTTHFTANKEFKIIPTIYFLENSNKCSLLTSCQKLQATKRVELMGGMKKKNEQTALSRL